MTIYNNKETLKILDNGAFLGEGVNRFLEKFERKGTSGSLNRNGNIIIFSRDGKKDLILDLDAIKNSNKSYSFSRFWNRVILGMCCCEVSYKERLRNLVFDASGPLAKSDPSPSPSPSPTGLKSGFRNAGATCWLASSLQLINAAPPHAFAQSVDALVQKDGETPEKFDQRKKIAGLVLELLQKSRARIEIPAKKILDLRKELANYRIEELNPIKSTGFTILCTTHLLYILGMPETKFLHPEGDEWEISCYGILPQKCNLDGPFDLGEAELELEDGIPKCYLSFIGKKEDAPPVIVTLNDTTRGPLKAMQDRDFTGRVPCTEDTYCDYELASVAISAPGHFYAYVKEECGWVKYDDGNVTVCSDMEAVKTDMKRGHRFLYRKLSS